MTWSVRKAALADADEIARINVNGWRAFYPGLVPDDALTALDVDRCTTEYREVLTLPDPVAVFLAVSQNQIGAFCGACPARNPDRDAHPQLRTGEIAALYVDPPEQGTGAGHAAHDAALAHLAETGFEHAVLWVLEANDLARRFYQRHGWGCDETREQRSMADLGTVPALRYSRSLG
ncbi:GNAT family N-acetyltransferase [Bounagaea algeriensis]